MKNNNSNNNNNTGYGIITRHPCHPCADSGAGPDLLGAKQHRQENDGVRIVPGVIACSPYCLYNVFFVHACLSFV